MTAPLPAPTLPRMSAAILPVTIGLGALLVVGAVVNGIFGAMFPSNAPVEQIYCFGVTVDLVAAAAAVFIRAVVIWRRPRGVITVQRIGVFAILAAVFTLVALASWLLLGGLEYWFGGMERYMSGAGGTFFAGIPWVLGLVFGEIALRRGDVRVNTVLSVCSLVVGVIIAIGTIAASVIYGLGLSA